MNRKYHVLVPVILVWFGMFINGHSQVQLSGTIAAGHTSNLGAFGSYAFMADYRYGQIGARFGISALPSSSREIFLNGIYIQGEYLFQIRERPLTVQAKYLWKPVSHEIREMDIAIALDYSLDHWYFLLGNNYRRYGLRKSFREAHGYDRSESSITEPWNLMYTVSYKVFPPEHVWNLSASFTNIDFFQMAQETNPMFNLKGLYTPRPGLDLTLESWYMSAGLFNIQVDYYGFFFRIGIVWTIPV